MAQIIALPPITAPNGSFAPVSATPLMADGFSIQANPTNTGTINVGDSAGNTIAILAAGGTYTINNANSSYNLNSIQLSGSAASQIALVSYTAQQGSAS